MIRLHSHTQMAIMMQTVSHNGDSDEWVAYLSGKLTPVHMHGSQVMDQSMSTTVRW